MNKPHQGGAGEGKSSCREKKVFPGVSPVPRQCQHPSLAPGLPRGRGAKATESALLAVSEAERALLPSKLARIWFHGTTAQS